MALTITKSNALIGVTPTITDPGINEVALNISDPDHSLNYTSGTTTAIFAVSYGAQSNISYVSVSGHTVTSGTINLYNGVTLIDSVTLKRSNTVMFTFPEMSFSDLKVEFVVTPNTKKITVSFIAAGQTIEIETGEQSGYKRNWLNRHLMQRTASNAQTAPVSSLNQNKAITGSLSLPNELALFSQDEWQDFIDYSFEQPFFIKEFESLPESSYICFDPKYSTVSHSETRALDVLKLSFTVFNGL